MGATFNETCYDSVVAAAAAFCATYPRGDLDAGGNPRVTSCAAAVDGLSATLTVQVPSLATSAATSVPLSFPVCDPAEHYTDLLTIWGVGIGCIAIIAAVKHSLGFLWENQ